MKSGLYFPNRFALIILRVLEEVLGRSGMKTICTRSKLEDLTQNPPADDMEKDFNFSDLSSLFETLTEIMGERGAQLIANRAGKAVFDQGLAFLNNKNEEFTSPVQVVTPPLHIYMNQLMNILNSISDMDCSVESTDKIDNISILIHSCPVCIDRTSTQPVCAFFEGLLSEAVNSSCDINHYSVKETECVAAGAEYCRFEITQVD